MRIGCDVANGTRTIAKQQKDGTYRLFGYKVQWFSWALLAGAPNRFDFVSTSKQPFVATHAKTSCLGQLGSTWLISLEYRYKCGNHWDMVYLSNRLRDQKTVERVSHKTHRNWSFTLRFQTTIRLVIFLFTVYAEISGVWWISRWRGLRRRTGRWSPEREGFPASSCVSKTTIILRPWRARRSICQP